MSESLFGEDVLFHQRMLKAAGLYPGALDGIWGPVTDRASCTFADASHAIAERLGRFDPCSERHIASLQLGAQEAARLLLKRVRKAGLDARVISGTRGYAEQNRLFRQGRYGNAGDRVTNARGGRSNHNFGIAWDIGLFDAGRYITERAAYDRAAEVGLTGTLEWGGAWSRFPDRPHYQIATGLSVGSVRTRFETGQPYC